MLEFIKQYQIFCAGIMGLSGVVITILANGYYSRKQYARDIQKQKASISAAIKAELEVNRSTFEERIKAIEKAPGKFCMPVKQFMDVYQKNLDKIGILDAEQVRRIVSTYLLIEEVPYFAQFHAIDRDDNYIVFDQSKIQSVKKILIERLYEIQKTIEMIGV